MRQCLKRESEKFVLGVLIVLDIIVKARFGKLKKVSSVEIQSHEIEAVPDKRE